MTPKQEGILLGTVIVALTTSSYFILINALCCLGVLAGAFTGTWSYTSSTSRAVEPRDGLVIGLCAGSLGFLLGEGINLALTPIGLDAQNVMLGIITSFMTQENAAMLVDQMAAESQSSLFIVGFLFELIIFTLVGATGGAFTAAFLGKTNVEES